MSDTQPAPTKVVRQHLHGALPVGARLRSYVIEAVLGHGGFGITYRARDTALGRDVAIKEYMPAQLAFRQEDTTVVPRSLELADDFKWGLERFLDEARTLAKFDRVPGVVRVYDYLQANGTAYMVMELVKGETLQQRLKHGPLPPEAVQILVPPLLQGLEALHAQGFLHRDIKPANVVLDDAGRPTLIDFGASRVAMAGRSTTLTAIFSPGYAAFEQMSADKQQGPWTDIYSLAATLYHAITGKQPPGALDRVARDSLEPLSRLKPPGFAAKLLAAIDAGLALRPDRRPQTIAQWHKMLGLEARSSRNPKLGPRRGLWLGLGIAAAVLVVGAGGYLFLADRHSGEALRGRLSDLLAQSAPAFPVSAREAQVARYVTASRHKALAAFPPSGSWRSTGATSAALAEEHALEACQIRYGNPCTLLAVNEAVQPPEVAAARRPMERVIYAGPFDPQKIPTVADDVRWRSDVAAYRGTPGAKSVALHPAGRVFIVAGVGSQREAEESALSICNSEVQRSQLDGPCFLYAIANDVVLARRALEPVTAPPSAPPATTSPVTTGPSLDKKLSDMVEAVSPNIAAASRTARISDYLSAPTHKALAAFPPAGLWRSERWSSAVAAEEGTLEACQVRYGDPCVLLAIDEAVQPAEVAVRRRPMPRVAYNGPFDPDKIPTVGITVRTRADVAGYRAAAGNKAAALHSWGHFFVVDRAASQRQAEEAALSNCNADPVRKNRDGPCFLYAVGDQVVLPRRATEPTTAVAPVPKLHALLAGEMQRLVPLEDAKVRDSEAAGYVASIEHKALAVRPSYGAWRSSGWASAILAEERTLEGCQIRHGGPCLLVAVDEVMNMGGVGSAPRPMPRAAYDGMFDPSSIPAVETRLRERPDVVGYRAVQGAKAAAFHPSGRLSIVAAAASQRDAEQRALALCNDDTLSKREDGPCFLYAAANQVVLPRRATDPITAAASEPKGEAAFRAALLEALAKSAPQDSDRETQVKSYTAAGSNKALAAFNSGTWRAYGYPNASVAEERALEGCQIFAGIPCVLVALNDVVQGPEILGKRHSMPRAGYEGLFELEKLPVDAAVRTRADVASYRVAKAEKAAAYHPWGRLFIATGAASQRDAELEALAKCNADPERNNRNGPCFLYAVGNQVVLPRRSTGPITAAVAPPPAGQPSAGATLRASLLDSLAKLSPSQPIAAREAQVSNYLSSRQHKALAAFPPSESWRRSMQTSPALAEEIALEGCQVRYGGPCILVAVNDALQGAVAGDGRRAMPRADYAGEFDPQKIPALSAAQRERPSVVGYRSAEGPKAAAFHPIGYIFFATNARNQREAEERALAECNNDPARNTEGGPCLLYAVGNQVVLPRRSTLPITAAVASPPASPPPAVTTLRASLLDSLAKLSPYYPMAAREAQVSAYLSSPQHKALAAFPPSESWRRSTLASAALAEEIALEGCQVRHGGPCTLVAVDDVLKGTGAGDERRAMPRADYAGQFDPQMIPAMSAAQRERPAVVGYRLAEGPKAAAFHPIGYIFFALNSTNQREAEEKALADCNNDPVRNKAGGPCLLYAIGNQVVLPKRQTKPYSPP